jgi:hypothetical protein
MSQAETTHTTSRRALLSGLATVSLLGAVPAAATAARPDAALASASFELTVVELAYDGCCRQDEDHPKLSELWHRRVDLLETLTSTPATTAEGIQAKASALKLIADQHCDVHCLGRSLAEDILGLELLVAGRV